MTKTIQYKNTSIGPIPTDWEVKKLGDLVGITSGNSPSDFNLFEFGKYPYLKVEDLNNNFKYQISSREYTDEVFRNIVKENSLIFPKRGAAIINNKIRICKVDCYLDSNLMALKVSDKAELDLEYLYYKVLNIKLFKIADTSSIPQLNNKHITPFPIPLPPLPEQQKIAEVLSTWDKAIQETDAIIKKLEDRNKALAFSLLTGKKRVKGFEGKWRNLKINEVFSEVKDINDGDDVHKVLTISAKNGFVSQEDKFDRVIAGNSLKKYTLLKNGDFAYNKGNSKTYEYGCIYVLDKFPSALVPFVYICFRPTLEISKDFYKHWFLNHSLDNQLRKIITSGARGDGLLNVSKDDFFNLKVVFPSLEEQNAIAEILNTANQEVKQYQQKLEALKLQKKGLMQQLLTGKVRTV